METKPPQFYKSQSLELIIIVIVINVVICGISGRLNMIGSCSCLIVGAPLQQLSNYTVRLQLCRLIRAKYSSLCTYHISNRCNYMKSTKQIIVTKNWTIYHKYRKKKVLVLNVYVTESFASVVLTAAPTPHWSSSITRHSFFPGETF